MAGPDDYDLGAAVVHIGLARSGDDGTVARWAIGEDPATVEAIGEAFRPAADALAAKATEMIESFQQCEASVRAALNMSAEERDRLAAAFRSIAAE